MAANRLMKALNNHGVKAKMLVRDKESDTLTVAQLPKSPMKRWHFLWERLVVFIHLHFSKQHLFEIDIANAGTDITKLREFEEADIIHLHWINQGMLSLSNIRKILRSGKPVVWTMHDIWPATGICHVTLNCRQFTTGCSHCRLLPGNGSNHGQKITNVPNCIDTHIYKKGNKQEARQRLGLPADKKLILFASQRVTNENKGMSYLIEACKQLANADGVKPGVVILGGHAEEVVSQLPLEAYPLGYVNDEHRIVDVYHAVDVFVLPSLSENLPNTIMEAMACGVPCVGFRVGGIPEEIDHRKNGYVAEYRNADDLARGISWILNEADYKALSENAIHKVSMNYSQQSVAMKYLDVYHQAMAFKHYRL